MGYQFRKNSDNGKKCIVHVPNFSIIFPIRRKATSTVTQQTVHPIKGLIMIQKMGVTEEEWNIQEHYQLLTWRITSKNEEKGTAKTCPS